MYNTHHMWHVCRWDDSTVTAWRAVGDYGAAFVMVILKHDDESYFSSCRLFLSGFKTRSAWQFRLWIIIKEPSADSSGWSSLDVSVCSVHSLWSCHYQCREEVCSCVWKAPVREKEKFNWCAIVTIQKMGNLLRLLSRDADSCCSIAKPADLFVDFESAQPTEEEAELYNEVEEVLIKAALILKQLQEYKGKARLPSLSTFEERTGTLNQFHLGASKEIKEAIGLATPEAEGVAWEAVKPLVSTLKDFYEFSNLLRLTLPKILNALCSSSPEALGNGNTR